MHFTTSHVRRECLLCLQPLHSYSVHISLCRCSQDTDARRLLLQEALSFENKRHVVTVSPSQIYANTLKTNDIKSIEYLLHSTTTNGEYTTIISIGGVNFLWRLVCNINNCKYSVDATLSPMQCRSSKNSAPTPGHEQVGSKNVCTATFFAVIDNHQTIDATPLSSGYRAPCTVSIATPVRSQ